ncbi:MAG: ABC transporter ATP-binding protein [Caulobacterales bacterium]|nr:ABC transporter ATP-binding protein [Caulobacterales bacterium]
MSVLLSLTNASVTLGKMSALTDVSLRVDGGEVVALLGPNGAGKTSLMRAVLGLVPLSSGAALLGGDDPRKLGARTRALRAAYLPQRPQSIWPISVEALVALGRFAHGAAPDRLASGDQAVVDAAIEACALAPLRARRMDEISGGEKARAHLARALAQRAPLLLLDEPTAGLDPAQALGVGDVLGAHAAGGGAAVFSTHDVALAAQVAQRIVLMRAGRVIADGAPLDALTPDALRAAYGRDGKLERIDGVLAAIFR